MKKSYLTWFVSTDTLAPRSETRTLPQTNFFNMYTSKTFSMKFTFQTFIFISMIILSRDLQRSTQNTMS